MKPVLYQRSQGNDYEASAIPKKPVEQLRSQCYIKGVMEQLGSQCYIKGDSGTTRKPVSYQRKPETRKVVLYLRKPVEQL
jgi:hypothetical protein